MAYLPQTKTPEDIKKTGVAATREAYNKLATVYNKIIDCDICYCHKCNDFKTKSNFYNDDRFKSGLFPICKECLLEMATDYDKKEKTYTDNREKTIEVFRMLNWPFNEADYKALVQSVESTEKEKYKSTAYQKLIQMVRSLPQYQHKNFNNSEFYENDEVVESNINKKARKEIHKIFGDGFTEADYLYLQDQYDDWKARTQVDSKSQETYIVRICFKLLDIWKAQKAGRDTTSMDKSLNELMAAANLQPKQNIANAATDSLTFGQLIEKWEMEEPIPEPSEEFKDVDGIGKYIRVWFSGWMGKALGIKNAYTQECDDYIRQYTVTKPEYQEEGHSDEIYEKLFGSDGE